MEKETFIIYYLNQSKFLFPRQKQTQVYVKAKIKTRPSGLIYIIFLRKVTTI